MLRRPRAPSLETLFVATFALFGLRVGLSPLGDNSLFVHLRTGIDIVRTGAIPRTDPYSFTALDAPWVVQSWLPDVIYGVVHRAGGFTAVRMVHGLLYAALAWLLARLARTGSPARTALSGSVAVGFGALYWSPRPLAFGLVAFALVVLIVRERRRPWLLVPVVWVWVNSHGSFALGLVWLAAAAAGEWMDTRRRPPVLRWAAWFGAGMVVSAVNPLGPKLLTFPLVLATKAEVFRHVIEWRSPGFRTPAEMVMLVCIVASAVILCRTERRPPWSDVLPVATFLALGLVAQRNLGAAAIVVAPALGRALRRPAAGMEREGAADDRRRVHAVMATAIAALAAVFVASIAGPPALDLHGYPVAAARLVPPGTRLVTTDVAGGYRVLTEGRAASVFIDDRYDMFPEDVTADYIRLFQGRPGATEILDRHRAEAVLWPADEPLAAQLQAAPGWQRVARREGWVLYVRSTGLGRR